MRDRRANLEGALARPGALQQRPIAAPHFAACALAVQMTDVVFQTNQEVQASTQAAGITVCGYSKLLHRALDTTSPSSSGLMQVMEMLGLKQHSCLKAVWLPSCIAPEDIYRCEHRLVHRGERDCPFARRSKPAKQFDDVVQHLLWQALRPPMCLFVGSW